MFFIIYPQFLRTYLETKKNLNAAVISFLYLLYIYYIKKFNKNQIKIFYGSSKEVRTPIARLKAAFPDHLEDEAINKAVNSQKPKLNCLLKKLLKLPLNKTIVYLIQRPQITASQFTSRRNLFKSTAGGARGDSNPQPRPCKGRHLPLIYSPIYFGVGWQMCAAALRLCRPPLYCLS